MIRKIESQIDKQENGFCWNWKGEFHKKWKKPFFRGRGKKKIWVHRWMYQNYVGDIPKQGAIYRLCWNNHCVNPDHLKLVMPGETQPTFINVNELHQPDFLSQSSHMSSIREEISGGR